MCTKLRQDGPVGDCRSLVSGHPGGGEEGLVSEAVAIRRRQGEGGTLTKDTDRARVQCQPPSCT